MNGRNYNPIAVLKLTVEDTFDVNSLNKTQKETLHLLSKEAKQNGFNDEFYEYIIM